MKARASNQREHNSNERFLRRGARLCVRMLRYCGFDQNQNIWLAHKKYHCFAMFFVVFERN